MRIWLVVSLPLAPRSCEMLEFAIIKNRSMSLREKSSQLWPRLLTIYIGIALLTGSFYVGTVVGFKRGERAGQPLGQGQVLNTDENQPAYLSQDVDFGLYWRVWNLLKERYWRRPVSDTKLFYGSLRGMVEALEDPYTSFLDPQLTSEFNSELSGRFDGIGAEIGIKDDQLMIIAPLPDTPASRAGIKAGDQIFLIDGADTRGMRVEEAVRRIRGLRDTAVTLLINRPEFVSPKEFVITRAEITIKSVKVEWRPGGLAVIDLYSFGTDTTLDFKRMVLDLIPKEPKGLILDLRNNPGGLLDSAIDIAGEWVIKDQIIVIEQDSARTEFRSAGPSRLSGLPTVVLVNAGTASGAEILAGALQDYKLARVIGTKTFGKGSVQDFYQFEDGSALKYTIAEWLTPLGRSINKNGIDPDEVVEVTENDLVLENDPQMARALEILGQTK